MVKTMNRDALIFACATPRAFGAAKNLRSCGQS